MVREQQERAAPGGLGTQEPRATARQAGQHPQHQQHRLTAPEQEEQNRSGDDNQGQPTALWLPDKTAAMRSKVKAGS